MTGGGMARRPTQCERLLELLGDGQPHTHHELYALRLVAHSRVSELRGRGYVIRQWSDTSPRTGEREYWYQLDGVPSAAASGEIDEPADELAPAAAEQPAAVDADGDEAAGQLAFEVAA